jgi:hypothetical protein
MPILFVALVTLARACMHGICALVRVGVFRVAREGMLGLSTIRFFNQISEVAYLF